MGESTAMWLMIVAAIITVASCLSCGRAVPWQGRQTVVVMALAMISVAVADGDSRMSLLAGTLLIMSAMLGTLGLRGKAAVSDCCHRALGSLVMAVCVLAGIAHGAATPAATHGAHLGADAVGSLSTLGVMLLLAWTVVDQLRPHAGDARSRALMIESWSMAVGVAAMWAMH